ncbi:hypothetical protein EJB05_47465, partial [Eragrostis curvula]
MALAGAEANKSEIDRQSLLCFKSGINSDPLGILNSWLDTSLNFCYWPGVTCGTGIPTRVVSLDLISAHLGGQISGCVANLTSLSQINLTGNLLSGPIPEELGTLQQLQTLMLAGNRFEGNIPDSLGTTLSLSYVNLANNSLIGKIPHSLANCSSLHTLILSRNNLDGELPATLFSSLPRLATIDLQMNSLTGVIPPFAKVTSLKYLCVTENFLSGSIPPSIGNVSSLHSIFLGQNKFTGQIPERFTHIPELISLDLSFNRLSGHVPSSIYNKSSLKYLNVGSNFLVGRLPSDIGYSLPYLEVLIMQNNKLEGLIPSSLGNASDLQMLDLSNNSLHGLIPSFGSLANMHQVLLGSNWLQGHDWTFLASLTNCTKLTKLSLEKNMLKASLPRSVCNLSSNLEYLALGSNQISGSIPVEIGNLVGLTFLGMENNFLSGSIPPTIGKLHDLYIINLSKNKLSGRIPTSIGDIVLLGKLFLDDNILSGSIPSSLGRCLGLLQLNLSSNSLDGFLPEELFTGPPLSFGVDLSHNSLTGPLPILAMGQLEDISLFNVSNNRLSGEIPKNLLSISQYIDLSTNELSGNVPEFFGYHSSGQIDLSYNNFEGPLPSSWASANPSVVHLHGNVRLCSNFSMLELPPCYGISDTRIKTHKNHKNLVPFLAAGVGAAVTIAFLLLMFCFVTLWKKLEVDTSELQSKVQNLLHFIPHWGRKVWNLFHDFTHWVRQEICTFNAVVNDLPFFTLWRRRDVRRLPSYKEILKKISYGDIAKATEWFPPLHRISSTRTGSVYVGRFKFDTDIVAIKVFNLNEHGAHESYFTECEVQRSVRHRNILKSMTLCSTLDTLSNEFKALVFPFMANGSLERWLHPRQQSERTISLGQRICIAMDVASAVDYLHNQVVPPLVHCDLKPNNILLDYDMVARVGDFGSAKFLSPGSSSLNHFISVNGTIGYLAPEYGMGCGVSTAGDVYSFGVLLLEMLTGKQPTDEMFVDGLSLHNYAESKFPDRVAEILDPYFAAPEEDGCAGVWMQSYVIPLVTLGLSCSKESAKDRPGMQYVCAKLSGIKEAYLESRRECLNT